MKSKTIILSDEEITLLLYGLNTRIILAERTDGVILPQHKAYMDLRTKLKELKTQ